MSRLIHWPLALLFLYSGAVKLFRLPQFAQAVGEFGIVWDSLVKPTSLVVCVIELGLAYALWRQKSWAMLATATLLVGFVGVLSYGVAIGLDIECGCFGSGYKLKLRQQLAFDLILVAWCGCGHYFSKNAKEKIMHDFHYTWRFVLAGISKTVAEAVRAFRAPLKTKLLTSSATPNWALKALNRTTTESERATSLSFRESEVIRKHAPIFRWFYVVAFAAVCVGCGTNKFEQEVTIEASSVKFAREAVSGQYPILSTSEVKKLLDDGTESVLLDAMPAASSFNQAHIPGAVNFEFPKEPMDDWTDESMPGRTKEAYAKLLGEDLDRLIVVYCGFVKCARSHNAAVFAKELGYTNVRRYAGGIYAWRGAGLPVESK